MRSKCFDRICEVRGDRSLHFLTAKQPDDRTCYLALEPVKLVGIYGADNLRQRTRHRTVDRRIDECGGFRGEGVALKCLLYAFRQAFVDQVVNLAEQCIT